MAGAFGFVLILANSRLKFFHSTILSALLISAAYFSFIYLRAVDVQLPYATIAFSGLTAFVVPNLYRYVNLRRLSGRLKDLAVTDPLTGFHTPRFFLLLLEERLASSEDVAFIAVRADDFRRLAVDLDFEGVKRFSRLLGEMFSSMAAGRFKRAIFTRLSNDTFALASDGVRREEALAFLRDFTGDGKAVGAGAEGPLCGVSLRGCLVYRPGRGPSGAEGLMGRMEELLNGRITRVSEGEFDWPPSGGRDYGDILDFIAYDLEERNKELERNLKELLDANRRLDKLSWGTLTALARAVDAKSPWTAGHSERVTGLALRTGMVLGLGREELDNIQRAGLLHDIGKIGIPQEILDKQGRLTDDEYMIMKEHPAKGASILEPVDAFKEVIPIVMEHHERYDGRGYPRGLAGEEITLGGRILAAADVFDAMVTDRPYRKGLPAGQVLEMIKEGAGTQFDPAVVDAFIEAIGGGTALKKAG